MKKDKKITIFCQAPANVLHILNLYEINKEKAAISVIVINVKSLYNYFKSLNLNLKALEFIPYNLSFSIRKPFSFIKGKKQLKTLYKKLLKDKYDETIYFFGIWSDCIIFYFLKELSVNNTVIYDKHYLQVTEVGRKHYTLKEKYILFQYYLLTGIQFQYTEGNRLILLFPYKKYNIDVQQAIEPDKDSLKGYLYKVKKVKEKSILFFESNLQNNNIIKDYEKALLHIMGKLNEQGYSIYIKGHPRLGHTKMIESMVEQILPQEIPAELIDVSLFNYIVGIQSFSLVYFSKLSNNVYSLINLLDFYDNSVKHNYINYLNENSKFNIKFVDSISELC